MIEFNSTAQKHTRKPHKPKKPSKDFPLLGARRRVDGIDLDTDGQRGIIHA
jgi:hypothetical protein